MNIAILGTGTEGKALAEYFSLHGDRITLCDQYIIDGPFPKGVRTRFGKNYLSNLEEFDVVFRSPGVSSTKREIKKFAQNGGMLSSATKYFFHNCPCPIVGVTGTKGKGTTTTLLAEMLKEGGKTVYVGGNIGTPPITFLDFLKKDDTVILELSSFQLQDLDASPHAAVVLGITPDHLDYHSSFEEYIESKKNIVRYQKQGDILVVTENNDMSSSFAQGSAAKVFVVNSEAIKKYGSIKTPLVGEHNRQNIAAAATCAAALGTPRPAIEKVIKSFKGLPHRLQKIAEKNEILFYDDSCSTTPDTCIAAVRAMDRPVILIAGGSDKGADYTGLGEELMATVNVRAVVLMGDTGPKIESAIDRASEKLVKKIEATGKISESINQRKTPLEIIKAESYQEAFMAAKIMAQPGDAVLLSPASASFDQFRGYRERGEIFQNFVLET